MSPSSPTRGPMPTWLRVLGWLVGIVGAAAIAIIGALWLMLVQIERSLPDYEAMKTSPKGRTVRIHADDGSVIQTLGPAYGDWLPPAAIPKVMKQAVIAIEDRRFEEHSGVDLKALARVTWFAWRHRHDERRLQGASTITQQAARTVFLTRRYDFNRKLKEMAIALAMERHIDKDRILALYLNRVYLGGGAYGIDAASRRFFGHPATSLTLSEASLLAGLAKAPSDYSPAQNQTAAHARQIEVLKAMVETGAASRAQARQAATHPPAFAAEQTSKGDGTAYFTDLIRPQIDVLAADQPTGVVEVETTIDPKLQALATAAVDTQSPKGAQGAIVTLDADGAIRAMVGGRDHDTSPFNRATQAERQPGSSFKLFVYIAALEAGMRTSSTVIDAPITIGDWSPRNSVGGFIGATSLANAFAQSINTVAARLGQRVGTDAIANVARRLGFTTPISTDPAMVLGSSEARLIDMTRAYATVAAGGVSTAPYGIRRITAGGRTLFEHQVDARLAIAPGIARDMTAMLQNNVATGTGAAAAIGRPVAGKTGTTTSGKDGWFMGSSSGLTTGVWIGRDDAAPIPGLQGGRAPARIFAIYMRQAVEGRPPDETEPLNARRGGDGGGAPAITRSGRRTEQVKGEDGAETRRENAPVPPPTGSVAAPSAGDARDARGRSRAVPMDEQ